MPKRQSIVRPSYVQALPDQLLFDFESKELKQCRHCLAFKTLDSFYREAWSRDGRSHHCKRCEAEKYGSETHKQHLADLERGLKRCKLCGELKPLEDYYVNHQRRHKRLPRCKECYSRKFKEAYAADPERFQATRRRSREKHPEKHRQYVMKHRRANLGKWYAYVNEWRAKNKDKEREYRRTYNLKYPRRRADREHRRRALKKQLSVVDFSYEELIQKMTYWGHRCWICGGEGETIDHVKPLAKGGLHILANLRPACLSCNCRKSDRWPTFPIGEFSMEIEVTSIIQGPTGLLGAPLLNAGAPTSGAGGTGLGIAKVGSRLLDTTNGKLYIATATDFTTTITWVSVGSQV
jgi:hypothetical protein